MTLNIKKLKLHINYLDFSNLSLKETWKLSKITELIFMKVGQFPTLAYIHLKQIGYFDAFSHVHVLNKPSY